MNKEDTTLIPLNLDHLSDGCCSKSCSPSYQAPAAAPISSNNLVTCYLKALFMAIVISLFFLLVSILTIIIHILVAGPVIHRRCHRRTNSPLHANSSEDDEEEENNLNFSSVGFGLSHNDLRKFPSFDYRKAVVEPGSTQDCIFCLEDFKEGELCRMLPKCKHIFHTNCIDSWLIRVAACPICRQEVVKPKIDRQPIRSNEV